MGRKESLLCLSLFSDDGGRFLQFNTIQGAINGKEKEFQKLLLTTKKLTVQELKYLTDEGIKDANNLKANRMYNFACGFAVAGNKTMAMKCLKIADKMHPDASYAKMAKSDSDFLNIKK